MCVCSCIPLTKRFTQASKRFLPYDCSIGGEEGGEITRDMRRRIGAVVVSSVVRLWNRGGRRDVITGAFRRGVVSLTFVLRLQWLRRGNWKLFMDVFIDRLMVNIEKRGERIDRAEKRKLIREKRIL